MFCDGINFAIDATITVTNLNVYNYTNETPSGGGFVTGDFGGANVVIENAYFEQVHTINLGTRASCVRVLHCVLCVRECASACVCVFVLSYEEGMEPN